MRSGRLKAVSLLLDAGADATMLDNAGCPALFWAMRRVAKGRGEAPPKKSAASVLALLQARLRTHMRGAEKA